MAGRYEDYLKAIYELSRDKGYTKVKEIANIMGVKPPSVTEMLRKLSSMNYIYYEKRLFVRLTDKGEREALRIIKRHKMLIKFLITLGVSEEVARRDACIIEHTLHPDSVKQLNKFVEFIETSPKKEPRWLQHFREFCEKNVHPCKIGNEN
jgi:DtxR family Mn-dependent transcriptional regulator